MKIAIISDSHDNVANLEKLIDWLNENEISVLIHAGDLSAPSVLKETLSPRYNGTVHMILGNVGDGVILEKLAKDYENIVYYGKKGEFNIEGRKIALVHTPEEVDEIKDKRKYDLIIYGHTHQSEIKKDNRKIILNPGTLGGLYNEATFAIYNTDSGEVEAISLNDIE